MRAVIRCALVAGAAVVLVASAAGAAFAGGSPVLAFSPATGSPPAFSYQPPVTVGQTASQVFTLKNTGGSASAALTITVTPSPAFTKTADTCTGTSLGPGKSCTVTVQFAPKATGLAGATLTAAGNKSAVMATDVLSGTGVSTPLSAMASAVPLSGSVPLSVAFTGTATGGTPPYSYSWNFGDGSANSTAQNPSHSYATAGAYNATLTVTDSSSQTTTSSVTITASTPPCQVTDTTSGQTYSDLSDAVAAAAAGDTLDVAGTCTGVTTVGQNLTITGATPTATLDGGGQGSTLTIGSGVTVTLNTLTITGGTGGTSGQGAGLGGGIFNQGTLTLNDVTINGNTAGQGGGIYNFQVPGASPGAVVTLAGSSTITGNTATGGSGGEGALGGGIFNFCGTLVNAIAPPTAGANVSNNNPDNISSECTT